MKVKSTVMYHSESYLALVCSNGLSMNIKHIWDNHSVDWMLQVRNSAIVEVVGFILFIQIYWKQPKSYKKSTSNNARFPLQLPWCKSVKIKDMMVVKHLEPLNRETHGFIWMSLLHVQHFSHFRKHYHLKLKSIA